MGLVADICPKSTSSERKQRRCFSEGGGGEKKFRSLQRDFTVADIRDFTRDRSRTSKCFHIWHRYELMTVRGKGEAGGGGVGPLLEGAPKDPVSEVVPGSRDPPVVPQLIR